MLVGEAKAIARRWVFDEVSKTPGFLGAYFAGSVGWMADDAPLPATSDLDVNVVLDQMRAPAGRGKLVHRGVLLEVTTLSAGQLGSPEAVLGDYHLAGGFRTPSVILDPSGRLTRLQIEVARHYARRSWVRRRCEHARGKVLGQLAALNAKAPFADQVIGWLFPTGVMTHVLLVAGLQNPTVRRRYAAVRALLADYGRLDCYPPLLALLGCTGMTRERVEGHLAAMEAVFDAATAVIRSSFPFASDLSDVARPVAVQGSRELIDAGLHREAVFWIAVTASRCQQVLAADAPPATRAAHDPDFRPLPGDLGIASSADLRRRSDEAVAYLPRVWETAEAIMAANPEIEDG